jgi:6-methylsalicylate decarboxylase
MTADKFDVHAHYLSAGAPRAPRPGQYFLASPMPTWSPEDTLAFMDRHGIATQMLSVPSVQSAPAARAVNIYGAELVKTYPGRFGLLASLPLTDVAAAMAEIAFSFDELNADGIILLTNYDGIYLGDVKFDGVFAELNRRSAVIFIHPTSPPGFDCVACGRPGPLIEFPFDTCRTVTDLLYAGVFERYTNLKVHSEPRRRRASGACAPTVVDRYGPLCPASG